MNSAETIISSLIFDLKLLQLMSFDRYLVITKPFDTRKWISIVRSRKAAYSFSVLGWILCAVLTTPVFLYGAISACDVCGFNFPQVKLLVAFVVFFKKIRLSSLIYSNFDNLAVSRCFLAFDHEFDFHRYIIHCFNFTAIQILHLSLY